LFKVTSGTEVDVCKKIINMPEVLDASVIYGEYDLVARVTIDDLEQLNKFLDGARNNPSIIFTSTMIVAREYKGKMNRNNIV
jgi:DNA-binding Lrp family transcriptional regulator